MEEIVEKKPSTFKKDLWQFLFLLIFIVIPFRLFVAQPFVVSGDSMLPTFENGEYLIIDQLSYHLREPERGDVVVFHYPNDPGKFFIKRLIGLPGETVDVEDDQVTITPANSGESFILDEPYLDNTRFEKGVTTLGEDQYFVMGDNRMVSFDSRSWGPLEEKYIVGRAFLRLFPISHASHLPGAYTYTENYNETQ